MEMARPRSSRVRGCDAHINVHTSCMLCQCVSVCGDEEPWSLVPWSWTVCGACWVDGGSRLSTPLTPLAERPCVRSVKYGAHTSRLTLYISILYYKYERGNRVLSLSLVSSLSTLLRALKLHLQHTQHARVVTTSGLWFAAGRGALVTPVRLGGPAQRSPVLSFWQPQPSR